MYAPGGAEMHRIRDYIWLGSAQAEAVPLPTLQEAGITHVLQVGTGDFISPTHSDSLSYCCVRALDFEGEDLLTKLKLAKAHAFIDEARSKGSKAGVSRSSTTVISYLMAKEGLSFEDGLVDVVSKRNCVAPNRGFCDQLRILQDQCDSQLENYRAEMLQEQREELSFRQWLALLMRCKERANVQLFGELFGHSDASSAQPHAADDALSRIKQRLEERKRLAAEGKYEGVAPPEGAQGCEEDAVQDLATTGAAGEYSLELA